MRTAAARIMAAIPQARGEGRRPVVRESHPAAVSPAPTPSQAPRESPAITMKSDAAASANHPRAKARARARDASHTTRVPHRAPGSNEPVE